ncbi:MAG: hypothetical protein AAGN46_12845 [Acidobacteriota bacterium]
MSCLPLIYRSLGIALGAALLCGPVGADLTVVSEIETKGPGVRQDGRQTTYIKGLKMRVDDPESKTATILDLEARQLITLNLRKERAEIVDLGQLAEQQTGMSTDAVEVSVTPTGTTDTVAGESCEIHDVDVRIAADATGEQTQALGFDMLLDGTMCLVNDVEGSEDYRRFYIEMAERGLFFGPPESAEAQPGKERGFTKLYSEIAGKGMAYRSDLDVSFDGSGFVARMLKKFSIETSTEVVSVDSGALADELFQIPAEFDTRSP